METFETYLQALNLGPWPTAGIIVALSIVTAFLTSMILSRVLARLANRTKTTLDDEAIRILRRPIFLTVVLVGLAIADIRLDLSPNVEQVTLSILKTIGIVVWLGAIFRLTGLLLDPMSRTQDRFPLLDQRTAPLVNNMIRLVAVGAAIYLVITAWHVDATAWLASAGIVGIAVGFAAKDTLSNVFSGVFILADSPYKVGDYVNFDTGERGEVTYIGLRSTRILTRDDIEVTVPNAVIGNAKIVNETGGRWPRRRVKIPVGVAYGSDIDLVQRVLLEAGTESDLVCQDPQPLVRFRRFGESSLDFDVMVWIEEPMWRGRVTHDILVAVYRRFGEEKIQIPFPQRDLYIKSMAKSGD